LPLNSVPFVKFLRMTRLPTGNDVGVDMFYIMIERRVIVVRACVYLL
jgi:hypothetical protein